MHAPDHFWCHSLWESMETCYCLCRLFVFSSSVRLFPLAECASVRARSRLHCGDFVVVICLNFIVRLLPVVCIISHLLLLLLWDCCCFFFHFHLNLSLGCLFASSRYAVPYVSSWKCVFVSERIAVNFQQWHNKRTAKKEETRNRNEAAEPK